MVIYHQRKYCWHLWRNREHVKVLWNISVRILHAEGTARMIDHVHAGLCHLRAVLSGSEVRSVPAETD